MKKIPTLFVRDEHTRLVTDQLQAGLEWVFECGIPTQKHDGTCCMVRHGKFYKRYELKKGKEAPETFLPAQDPDPTTGNQLGWVLVDKDNPADVWHTYAFSSYFHLKDGTYELVGPKINGNPEKLTNHFLITHGAERLADVPKDFAGLKAYLSGKDIEGIVWHHPTDPDKKAKLKKKDFGFRR